MQRKFSISLKWHFKKKKKGEVYFILRVNKRNIYKYIGRVEKNSDTGVLTRNGDSFGRFGWRGPGESQLFPLPSPSVIVSPLLLLFSQRPREGNDAPRITNPAMPGVRAILLFPRLNVLRVTYYVMDDHVVPRPVSDIRNYHYFIVQPPLNFPCATISSSLKVMYFVNCNILNIYLY